jgi:hypothetical protein
MGMLGKANAESIGISILRKTPAILGCLLFLFSVIYPLYYNMFITLAGGGSTYYWSYELTMKWFVIVVLHSEQYWFSNYWFSSYGAVGFGLPWIFISMFALQVLTLIFGVASVIFDRRIVSFAPVLFSLAVMALMIYTGEILTEHAFYGEYQLGYYLIYPSFIVFLSAFVLNEVIKKKQTTKPEKENRYTPSPVINESSMGNFYGVPEII